jgi:hypothetical protein
MMKKYTLENLIFADTDFNGEFVESRPLLVNVTNKMLDDFRYCSYIASVKTGVWDFASLDRGVGQVFD